MTDDMLTEDTEHKLTLRHLTLEDYDYVNNNDLIVALDLVTSEKREQKRQIVNAFKKLEEDSLLKYEFIKNKNYWKKTKNRTSDIS